MFRDKNLDGKKKVSKKVFGEIFFQWTKLFSEKNVWGWKHLLQGKKLWKKCFGKKSFLMKKVFG